MTGYPVHYGGVCEGGISCTGDRSANRDLYDDFGIAVSPVNNAAAIIYSDDRYSEYNHTSRCTPAQDNTGVCDHTNIATGVSSIFTTGTGGNGGGAGNGGGGPGGGDGGAGAGWGDNGGHGGEGQQTSDTTSGGADRMSGPR